jgi:crotonobetainyl-CoA:carnitine CoA-transferase CaiB-like acyl-CoA transferase
VSVNLKCAQGAELCLRMMEKVDVVIENFRPGTMSRLGLGYELARAKNPRIVYCSISGYGQNGPSRDEPAMDLILQASSGFDECDWNGRRKTRALRLLRRRC